MGQFFNANLMDKNFRFRKVLVNPPGGQLSAVASQEKPGIGAKIRGILEESPNLTRSDVRARLEKDGWDFKGKSPANSINMVFASLARQQRSKDGVDTRGEGPQPGSGDAAPGRDSRQPERDNPPDQEAGPE